MKLYFAPGACSLAPHIVANELGIKIDLEQVDIREKKTKSGGDYWAINPRGQVPTLELDNGERLTEVPALLQYPVSYTHLDVYKRQRQRCRFWVIRDRCS